jgi:hypothetical protein
VLLQPFFNTDLMYHLLEECEAMLDQLLPYWTNEDGTEDINIETSLCILVLPWIAADAFSSLMRLSSWRVYMNSFMS